ncbi:MAG: 3-deoxy-manno-octulosonate cytidylyltransferase [Proteobacteria bacterium]|nr:3-deoxy-manno-octulosonate cytidylyltransferase [Pseudomonadota bacterium]
MKAIAILPARMGASRFPGKPLHPIMGIPMIGHCYFRTRMVAGLAGTYVATCDQQIADYVSSIGGKSVMTSSSHNRATDRTAEAMAKIESETGERMDIIVMVQGDEPLILPESIGETLRHFNDPGVEIVNIMSRLRTREQFEDKNNVKVVVNQNKDALYFSREPIPSPWKGIDQLPMYMQVGVIAFRRETLIRFNKMPETILEKIESVDMNRVLETGGRIRMVLTDAVTIGVDTPDEADEAGRLMQGDPLLGEYPCS